MSTDKPSTMKTYCELWYPGSFFAEEQVVEVEKRQPSVIAKKYPNAFALPDMLSMLKAINEQLKSPARNTVRGNPHGYAVIISSDVRAQVENVIRRADGERCICTPHAIDINPNCKAETHYL